MLEQKFRDEVVGTNDYQRLLKGFYAPFCAFEL
jgi:hypothetical protein